MMKGITFQGKALVALTEVPLPNIQSPTDVIVNVLVAGLCGSDLHTYTQREPGLDVGTVMGHEFMGVVVDVGEEVELFEIGDRVVGAFSTCCGVCYYCIRGLSSRCEHNEGAKTFGWRESGKGVHGAQAEYVRVPIGDGTLLKLPNHVPDEIGLFVGDILATGYFCALQSGIRELKNRFPMDNVSVAVIGCGPVGIMTAISARYLGADIVFGIDLVEERRNLAIKIANVIPLDPSQDDVVGIIRSRTQNRGVDCACECVGLQQTSRLAFNVLRPGGFLSSVGVQTEIDFTAFSPIEGYDKNITYRSGRCPVRSLMPDILPILETVDLSPLISHRISLHNANAIQKSYQMFLNKDDNCTKVIFLNNQPKL